ncbi:hypothetical protein MPF_0537 [Methanohalophilus portucalensis FDF-1]|uniref:Uncharacterized protein n=1 Tax=Methanohalophilus portucalensis FDF-1 TaxID=523843 RepID=A0A1L9C5C1_9EURY|nr:hypothetical protein MPF_0537 [Methanohalophilus portucalensis FDF-1]
MGVLDFKSGTKTPIPLYFLAITTLETSYKNDNVFSGN